MWALVMCGVVETVVLHFLIPWQSVRLAVDVLSLLALVWLLSLAVTPSIRPHLLTFDTLVLRSGPRHEVPVPRQQIGSATARERTNDSRRSVSVEGDVLSVAVARRTNVDLQLSSPMVVGGVDVRCVRFFCDEPTAVAAQLAGGERKVV
jgi:hypothetical protein